ncbi:DUF1775 domain-containing protein [Blastococcus colisei]|nr:DUF1775 domain-containing protein [Blastococcus colisei]
MAASVVGLVLMSAGSAGAHIEVFTDAPVQAGTGPVTLHFMAESESQTVGIVSVKTQLPEGIAPGDVALASGPEGWALTPTADGFELGGPPVAPGVDAEYSVTVALLPADSTELPFKTLQRYADGREDAWIELPSDAAPEPQMPAPVLTVTPAAPGAATPSAPTADETATSGSADTAAPVEASQSTDEESNAGTIALVAGLLVAVAIGAGVWFWRARRSS